MEIKKEKPNLSNDLKMEECEKYKTKVDAINATSVALEKVMKNKSDSEELSWANHNYNSVYDNLIATQSELDTLNWRR